MLDRITPLILTRDEEANIGRTLAQLAWAREVVVVDSLSSDDTINIARRFANVRVIPRAFDTHDRQWSFGVEPVTIERLNDQQRPGRSGLVRIDLECPLRGGGAPAGAAGPRGRR